jgi:hypothetical protein
MFKYQKIIEPSFKKGLIIFLLEPNLNDLIYVYSEN